MSQRQPTPNLECATQYLWVCAHPPLVLLPIKHVARHGSRYHRRCGHRALISGRRQQLGRQQLGRQQLGRLLIWRYYLRCWR